MVGAENRQVKRNYSACKDKRITQLTAFIVFLVYSFCTFKYLKVQIFSFVKLGTRCQLVAVIYCERDIVSVALPTWSSIPTVTQVTIVLLNELVHVKSTTIPYTYVVVPMTAFTNPGIAYPSCHDTVTLCGMRAAHPARRMGTTMVVWYT